MLYQFWAIFCSIRYVILQVSCSRHATEARIVPIMSSSYNGATAVFSVRQLSHNVMYQALHRSKQSMLIEYSWQQSAKHFSKRWCMSLSEHKRRDCESEICQSCRWKLSFLPVSMCQFSWLGFSCTSRAEHNWCRTDCKASHIHAK